jgi:hypothetical protein
MFHVSASDRTRNVHQLIYFNSNLRFNIGSRNCFVFFHKILSYHVGSNHDTFITKNICSNLYYNNFKTRLRIFLSPKKCVNFYHFLK